MYFPIGWPKYLSSDGHALSPIHFIVSSCDRMFFAVLSDETLTVWYSKPCVQIVCHTQTEEDCLEYGTYLQAVWKPDSSMIAVLTAKCHVVFFKVEIDVSVPHHHCLYVQQEGRAPQTPRHNINGILDSDSVPAIKLSRVSQVPLDAQLSCFLSVRDELVVSTTDGLLNRLRWNGNRNEKATLHIRDIPISQDLQQLRATKLAAEDGYVVEMEYSPTLGGYSMVLSSGKGIFVMPPSTRSEKTSAHGVRAQDLNNAVCVAVNHRYRLLAFGCSSGEGVAYMIDEVVGSLEISHKLVISSKEYPDAGQIAGPVQCMRWTPDGTALALTWKNGGFSLWSVFGALLVCTLGGDFSLSDDGHRLYPPPIVSMEWGLEGYHLWAITQQKEAEGERQMNGGACSHGSQNGGDLLQFQFVKSALTVNPCVGNHEHVFLQGEDKLYMSTGDTISRTTSQASGLRGSSSSLTGGGLSFIGNKQWQIIPISHSYLAANWPIRYSAVDRAGQCVAVAGKTGFAHYALFNRKWKLFGNETQERDMVVSGGITWWKDFICLACYNIQGQRDEIRFYPRGSKLDNTFAQSTKVPSQVLLLNTFRDILIIFCADSHVMLFNLERKNTQPNPAVAISKIQEVSLNNFIPHPLCVCGLSLTSLTSELGTKAQHSSREAESMLLNVSGKLLMFQRDRTSPVIQSDEQRPRPLPFSPPSTVATSVENLWATSRANLGKMQLMEALWLGCGAHGMKVWLPLMPRNEGKAHNFMSKRIMLPFRVDIYPLAVLFEDAVILGAACDAVPYNLSTELGQEAEASSPLCMLERTSQIYLHHILRQLLRRNLGVNALDLARSCTELFYFPHVLELLLHEVLEAEATSKDPIPDPLLPRVVAFIQEFPEFLQTVVHCARKTEVALWPYLFSTVGNPKDLFEECLLNADLNTAASYLIILQNLEKPMVSRQHATLLLDAALDSANWELCRDLVRFLKAIDPADVDAVPQVPAYNRTSSSSFPAGYGSPPLSPVDAGTMNFANVSNVSNLGRVRTASLATPDAVVEIPKAKEKVKHTISDSQIPGKKPVGGKGKMGPSAGDQTADQVFIDMILCRHARKLLQSNQLRALGSFAANMDDFSLVGWLRKERVRAAKVEDFLKALRDLHQQFEWPLPLLSYTAFQQMKKNQAFSTSSLASSSLMEEEVVGGMGELDRVITTSTGDTVVVSALGGTLRQLPLDSQLSSSDDIFLRPQNSRTEDSSVATNDISDSNSIPGDYEFVNDSLLNYDQLDSVDLLSLSQEIANKGPHQAEVELRYLLQILLEAGCLEWALIVAVVLRDTLAVVRTVNTASMTDTPLEMVARMREGLSYLELWADTECVGYRPFLHAIRTQIQVLAQLVEQTPPMLQLDIEAANRGEACVEEGNSSPTLQAMRPQAPKEQSPPPQPGSATPSTPESGEGRDSKGRECVVS